MTEAYDANIDTAVSLGWSYVEKVAFAAFTEEIASAPANAQATLKQLASLYGLTRIERGLSFFLASGLPFSDQDSVAALLMRHRTFSKVVECWRAKLCRYMLWTYCG